MVPRSGTRGVGPNPSPLHAHGFGFPIRRLFLTPQAPYLSYLSYLSRRLQEVTNMADDPRHVSSAGDLRPVHPNFRTRHARLRAPPRARPRPGATLVLVVLVVLVVPVYDLSLTPICLAVAVFDGAA